MEISPAIFKNPQNLHFDRRYGVEDHRTHNDGFVLAGVALPR
jgi:hypothetical protein